MSMADPTNLKVAKQLGRSEICFRVARVPASERLFFGASDGKVYDVDFAAEKPEPQPMEGHTSYVMGVALAGQTLVTGSYDGKLIWWNTDTRAQIRTVDAHSKWIRNLVATPDGKFVVSVADDMVAKVWNVETGELAYTLEDHQLKTPNDYPSMLFAVAVIADSSLIATGDKPGHIAIWETATGKKVGEVEAPGLYTWDPKQRRHSIGGIRSLAFSPDGTRIAAGGIGKIGNIDHLDGPSRLEIFTWKDAAKVFETEDTKLKGLIEKLAYHPSGEWLVGAGGDHGGFVNIYEMKEGKVLKQEKAPMHVHDFVPNEDLTMLYTVGHGKVASWEMKATEPAATEAEKPAEEAKTE